MDRPKPRLPVKRVWRISQSAPMGEWVEIVDKPRTIRAQPPVPPPAPDLGLPEVSYGSWVTSSYDLLDGTEVNDDPDTLPGDLFDEWFPRKPDVPDGRGK